MARYLFQASYTSEAWTAQVKNPQNRIDVIRPVIERLGGRIECAYFAFGDYDLIGIMEMPDNVSAAAFSLAGSAGASAGGPPRSRAALGPPRRAGEETDTTS